MATYKPLFMYVSPASVPQIVAHIQKYLADNPIVSDPEAIAEVIQQYIEEHPEIVAVASVNGKTGNVVLTGSDININASSAVTIETQLLNLASMISTAGSNISQIQAQLETIYTNINTLDGKVAANETAIDNLETSVSGHGTRIAAAETDIDNLETTQTAQGTRLNTAEGNISNLQTRMTQAETDIDSNESNIETLQTNVSNLNNAINDISGFGTNTNGNYYKFYDGTLICTKSVYSGAVQITGNWGSLFETTNAVEFGSWAYPFINDTIFTTLSVSGSAVIAEALNGVNRTSAGRAFFCRATSSSSADFTVTLIAIGRWK